MHDKTALILEEPLPARRVFSMSLPWKKRALATVAILTLLGVPLEASALALGAIQVKSALGEPLRAEVEVPEISSTEASTFQAALGTPQEFQAVGVDYNQVLRGTRITLSRRPNGQAYLSVEGQQPVGEPFLGLVISATWANGHVVRDYTLLVDPRPQLPASGASTQSLPQAGAPATPPSQRPPASGVASTPAASGATSSGTGEQVQVQRGDTATSLVQAHPIDGVSLDQMLVAMLRSNPQAFIQSNVNLIRAGAVVNMPNADQASAITPTSARKIVIAQSRDFQAYRQGLAGAVTRNGQLASGNRRSATGRVQPQVQEAGATHPPPDRLTLSRGKVTGNTAARRAETRISQSRQASEQAAREAELRRNINELSQLATNSGGSAARAKPGINVPPPAFANAATTPDAAASTPATSSPNAAQPTGSPAANAVTPTPETATSTASATASSPATAASRFPVPVSPSSPPPAEPSIWDTLQDNLSYIGGLIVALLVLGGGYYAYRNRQQTKRNRDSSVFSESKFPADSFFGNSGGQRVNTRENSADANSSIPYSPSQLEAAGDVDPISEADVYLAYGRDAQAEEILQEALRTYPGRVSIYAKLAEIYAKRQDAQALNALATEAHRVTRGKGSEWQIIAHWGKEIDPGNPLYQSSSVPIASAATAHASSGTNADADTETQGQESAGQQPANLRASGIPAPATTPAAPPTPAPTTTNNPSLPRIETVNFTPPATVPTAKAAPNSTPPNSGMVEFSIDSPSPTGGPTGQPGSKQGGKQTDEDPLATKLALAQEFHAIGDDEGARKLAKEVVSEASGTMKIKAVRFLTDLG